MMKLLRLKRQPLGLTMFVLLLSWQIGQPLQAATIIFDSDADGTNGVTEAGGTYTWIAGQTTFYPGGVAPQTNVATTNNTTTDIAQFGNGGTLASAATINIATQSINGLIFDATTTNGYTLTASTTAQVLTIGASGITLNAGTQATSVGSANLGIALAADQTWTNNSTSSNLTLAGALTETVSGTATLTFDGSGNISMGMTSAASFTLNVVKNGAGTTTWTSDPNLTGAVTVNNGVLVFQTNTGDFTTATINSGGTLRTQTGNNVLSDSLLLTINSGGGYDIRASDTIGAILGAGTVSAGANATLSVSNGTNRAFSGILQNGVGTLAFTKGGANTVTLSGSNTYTGTTSVNTGTLLINGAAGTIQGSATITIGDNNGAADTLTLGAVGDAFSGTVSLGRLSDTAAITIAGSSIFNYNGPASGFTTETVGTLTTGLGSNTLTLTPGTASEIVLAGASIARTATGLLLLRGTNLGTSGTGNTRLTLTTAPTSTNFVGGAGAAGSTTMSIVPWMVGDTSATGAGLGFVTYDGTNGLRPLTGGEYVSTISGAAATDNVSLGAADTVSGAKTVNSLRIASGGSAALNAATTVTSGAVLFTATGELSGAGSLNFGAVQGIITAAANTTAITGTISAPITGTVGILINSTGSAANIVTLSGANTFTGGVVVGGGTLRLGSTTAFGSSTPQVLNLAATNAVFELSGNNITVADLAGAVGSIVRNSTAAATTSTLTIQSNNNSTFGGSIVNGNAGAVLNLIKRGSGALSITGTGQVASSYTGTTLIQAGTMAIGSTPTAASLSGTSAITLEGGTTLRLTNASGNNGDRLANGAIIAMNGATFDFDNNAAASTNFTETQTAALTLGAGGNVITVDKATTGQTSTLTFGSLARTAGAGATLELTSQNNGTAIFDLGTTTQSRLVFTTPPASPIVIGGIIPFAVTRGAATNNPYEFVKYVASGTISATAAVAGDYAIDAASGTWVTGNNIKLTAATSPTALAANRQINSLNFQSTTDAISLDLSTNTLRVESGGILASQNTTASVGTTITGGTLTAGTAADTAGELMFHVFNIGTNLNTLTVNSVVGNNGTGAVSVTKAGSGTLKLGNTSNTYTGATSINGGTLQIVADGSLGAAPGTTTANFLRLNGGTLQVQGTTTIDSKRGIGISGAGGTITVDPTFTATYGGIVADNSTNGAFGTLTKTGTGTLSLGAANTYTGITNITAGILNVGSLSDYGVAGGLGNRAALDDLVSANVGIHINGGTLQYTGSTATSTNRQIRILNGTTGATIDASGSVPAATMSFTYANANTNFFNTAGTRTLTLTGTNTGDNLFALNIQDQATSAAGTTLAKTGSGTWVITNPNNAAALNGASNTFGGFSGGTVISGGRLVARDVGALGAAARALTIGGTGATLDIQTDTSINALNTTINGTATIISNKLTASSAGITHTLGTLSIGANQLNITAGSNVSSGTAGVTFGATTLTTPGPAVFDTGTGTLLTLGAVGGAFAFTKQGAGQLTLATTSTRTTAAGITNLSAGTLRLNTANALNTLATAPLNISGGTLSLGVTAGATYGGTATTVSGNASVESDRLTSGAGVTQTLGTLSIGAFQLSILSGANVASGTAGVTFGNTNLTGSATFNTATGTNLTLPLVTSSGTFDLIKTGAGTLTLSGANTYSGGTTISGGVLVSGTAVAVNFDGGAASSWIGTSSNVAANLVIGGGGILRYAGPTAGTTDRLFTLDVGGGTISNNAASSGTLAFTNTGSIVAAGSGDRTLTLTGSGSGTFTFNPTVVDPSSGKTALVINQASTGTIVVAPNANNTFTGGITVQAGILRVVNSFGLGGNQVSFGAGTTLDLRPATVTATNYGTGGSSLVYGNNNATISLNNTALGNGATMTVGPISLGSGTLTIAHGTNFNSNTAHSLVSGAVTLTGNPTILVNNGTGTSSSTVTLGALNDGGVARTITVSGGAGTAGSGAQRLVLGSDATTFTAGTNILFNPTNINLAVRLTAANGFGSSTNKGLITFQATGGLQFLQNTATTFNTNVVIGDIAATLTVGGTSAINALTHTAGTLSVGNTTVTLATANQNTNHAHSLTFGATTFTGNTTFTLNNTSGTGSNSVGSLILGALNDGGSGVALSKNGAGTLQLNTAAASMVAGTTLTNTAGNVQIGNNSALGSSTLILGNGTISGQLVVSNGVSLSSASTVTYAGGYSTLTTGAISGPASGSATINGTININSTVAAETGHFMGGGGTLNLAGPIVTGGTSNNEIIIRSGNIGLNNATGNTYTSLRLNAGNVTLGVTDAIPTSANVAIAELGAATVSLSLYNQTIASGAVWTLGGSGPTLETNVGTIDTGSGGLILNGTIANNTGSLATQLISGSVSFAGTSGTFNIDSGHATSDMTVSANLSNGSLLKTGAGILTLTGAKSLTSLTISNGAVVGGYGAGGVGTISIGASGSLQLVNNVAETLTLNATAGALNVAGGARIGFELGAPTTSDRLVVGTGGSATTTGTITLDFYNLGGLAAGTYTLLSADSGLITGGTTYNVGSAPLGFNYSINATDTLVQLTTSAYTPRFWTGSQSTSWNTSNAGPLTNWATDAAGTVNSTDTPASTHTIIFSATNAIGPVINTTLDAAFAIDAMQFLAAPTGVTAVNIGAGTGGTLAIAPATSSAGIYVDTNAGTATFSAGLPLTASAAQTWNVVGGGANGSALVIAADTAFNAAVTKSGAGVLTLSGTNSGSATLTLAAGTLNINSTSALGGGTFAIGGGTTINNSTGGAITLTANNVLRLNGNFTFSGTQSLNLGSGAISLPTNVSITSNASNLTLGGAITEIGTRALTKLGAGMLTLGGNNAYSGGMNLNAGTLNINNAGALGTGTFTIAGGTLDNTSGAAITNSNNNAQTWNASYTFTGTNNLNLGTGAVSLGSGAGTSRTVTVSAGALTIGGAISNGAVGTGITKAGVGTLTLSGASTYTGNTLVNAGTLNIAGTLTGLPASTKLNINPTTGNNAVVNYTSSGTSTLFAITGATVAGTASVFNQTSGVVNLTPDATTGTQSVVGVAGAYGYYNITGGTLRVSTGTTGGSRFTMADVGTAAATNGTLTGVRAAVVYVGGTGFIDHTNAEWWLNYSLGQTTVADSGKIDHTGSNNPFAIFMNTTVVGGGYGVLNLAGANAQVITGAQPIRFGNSGTAGNGDGNSGFVNLAAGTLSVGANVNTSLPSAPTTINNAYFNFAGGTLKATAALTGWIPVSNASINFNSNIYGAINNSTLSGAPSFNGGMTVDTNSFAVTIGNPLQTPGGAGVTQANLSVSGGSGYIGAPAVIFSSAGVVAGGSPAAGYALISGGQVTGIVITSPGTYTAGTVPTITLLGGGGTGAVVTSSAVNTTNVGGGLTKIGTGTLTLSGANTYTGGTTISAGSLALGANNTLPSAGAVTISGGTLNLAAFTNTVGVVTLDGGGTIAGTSGTLTSTSNYELRSGTVSGVLGGTVGINKSTAGTVTVSSSNTLSGAVNVNAGTLAFATSGNLGNASSTNVITFDGGTLNYTGSGAVDLTSNRVATFNSGGGTIDVTSVTGSLTLGGISTGTGNFTKTGAGTVIIPGTANLGTGGVVVNNGVLRAGFGTSGTVSLNVGASANLQMVNNAAQALTLGGTVGALTLAGGAILGLELGNTSNYDSITVGVGGTAVTAGTITLDFINLSGGLTAGTYNLISAPSGLASATWVKGNAPAGFNYTLNVSDSLISLITTAFLPRYWTGDQNNSWATDSGPGNTNWSSTADGLTEAGAVPSGSHTIIFSATNATGPAITTTLDAAFTVDSMQFIAAPTGVNAVTVNPGSAGTLTLAPVDSANGIFVDNNAGNVTFGASLPLTASTAQTWKVDGTGTSTLSVAADVTFTAGVTKSGAGTLTLSGANSGAGGLTLAAGTLNLNTATAPGTGTLTIQGGTTINNTSVGSVTLSNNNLQSWNGNFTFTGGNALNLGIGAVTLGANVSLTASASTLTVGGVISGGARALTKLGAGVLTLNGANTFSGGLNLSAGTLQIGNAAALGAGTFVISGGTIFNNTSGGTLTNSGNNAQTWDGDFTFTGTNSYDLGTGAVTLGTSAGTSRTLTISANTLTVGGVISNGTTATQLIKTGAGTLNLNASNTYNGGTVIANGTLVASTNASLPSSGVVFFGSAVATAVTTTIGQLDLTSSSPTTGAINVYTNSTSANTITIGTGKVLTTTGNVTVGASLASGVSTTVLNVTGARWDISGTGLTVRIGGGNVATTTATLDLTGLTTFNAALGSGGAFRIGSSETGANPTDTNVVKLAVNSTITAGTIDVGASTNHAGSNTLSLGSGSNTLNADTINVGSTTTGTGALRANGVINFTGAAGSVQIRAANGSGAAVMNIVNTTAGTAAAFDSSVTFAGFNADVLLSTLTIGARGGATVTTGNAVGALSFNQGTFNATTVVMGSRFGSTISSANVTGNLTLGGGTVSLGAVTMSQNSATTAATSGNAIATLALGGTGTNTITTLNMGSNSVSGLSATGGTQATLTVTGGTTTIGTLNMAVNAAGVNAGVTNAISDINISGGSVQITGNLNMGNTTVNALNTVTNTLNLTGSGSLTVGGNIAYTNGIGTENVTINLNGGTLDMTAGTIGAAGALVTFNSQSGTLKNLAELNNGSGLTKTTAGTLIIDGTNTYTAATTISNGTLQLGAGSTSGTIATTSSIINNGTLAFNRSNTVLQGTDFSGAAITGTGGLTKLGTGSLVLTANNAYSGNTLVSAGTLFVNGTLNVASNVTVANGGTLGGTGSVPGPVTVNSGGAIEAGYLGSSSLTLSTLNLGTLAADTAGITLSNIATGTPALLNVTNLNINTSAETILLNIINTAAVATETYKLIGYGTLGGSGAGFGAFKIGTVSGFNNRQTLSLFNNTSLSQIELKMIGDSPKWTGFDTTTSLNSSVWHPSNPSLLNWKLFSANTPTDYQTGDQVLFNDDATGSYTVDISNGNVDPASVVFNNSDGVGKTYTLQGSNGITGSTSLTKNNTGTLIINNANSFTGGVVINNGVVQLGNTGALGTGNLLTFDAVAPSGTKLQLYGNNATVTGLESAGSNAVVENGTSASTNATLTVNQASGNKTFAGALQNGGTDTLGLSQTGAGTLILTGTNTYTGGTSIGVGSTLQVGAAGTSGSLVGNATVNGTLRFNRSDSVPYGGTVSGSGTLSVVGGTLVFTGTVSNTLASTAISNGATLQIGNGSVGGTVSSNVANAGVLSVNLPSGSTTLGGVISGVGALNTTGAGTTILTGSNTYSGGTIIGAGTILQIGNGSTTGSFGSGAVTINGTLRYSRTNALTITTSNGGSGGLEITSGRINLDAAQNYLGSTTVSSGAILHIGLGGTTGSLAGDIVANGQVNFNRSDALSYAGVISGAGTGSVIILGAGTTTFSGTNTYAGPTSILAGTLSISASNNLGNAAATNTISLSNGAILQSTGVNVDLGTTRSITLGSGGGVIDVIGTNVLVVSGVVSGTTSLSKTGVGTLTLSGVNTHSGGTTFSAGTLNITQAAAIGSGLFTIAGGTIDVTGASGITLSNNVQAWNGDFTFTGTKDLNLGTGAVTLSANRAVTVTAGTLTVGGIIDDGAGNFTFTKNGAGTLYLAGVNTFGSNSAVTISGGGVLKIDAESGLGTNTNDVTFGTGGGTLQVTSGFAANTGKVISVQAGPGTIQVDSGTLVIGSAIVGTATATANGGGLIKTGAGTLALTVSSSSYDAQGVASAGSGATGVGFRVDAGTLLLQGTSTSVVGDITPNSMAMQLNGGNLTIQTDTASIARANLWVSSDATLTTDRATAGGSLAQAIGTGTGAQLTIGNTSGSGGITLNVAGGANYTSGVATVSFGATTLNRSATFNITDSVGGGATLLSLGAVTGGTNSITLTGNGDFAQTGAFVSTAAASLTLNSGYSGLATLSQTNTYTGSTTINGGTLAFSTSANLGDATQATNTLAINGGTLSYSGVGSLNLGANRSLTVGSNGATLNVSGAAGVLTVSGAFSSSGNLTKTGVGSVNITSAPNWNAGTGALTVNGGLLAVGLGASGVDAITVAAGATLYNTDASATPLVLPSTGSLTLNAGAVLGSASKLGFSMNGTTATAITLDASTSLTINSTVAGDKIYIDLLSLGVPLTEQTYNLITDAGNRLLTGSSGAVTYALDNVIGGYVYTLNPTAGLVSVTVSSYNGSLFWLGDQDNSWTTYNAGNTNWNDLVTSGTDQGVTPGSQTTVVFGATEAAGPTFSTTLDGNVTIKNLQFTSSPSGVTAVSIGSGTFGSLTIGNVLGIDVAANAGAITISAPIILGASQTWAVNGTGVNGSSLTVTGGVSGTAGLTISSANAGIVTLSGPNLATYVGTTTVSSGILQAGAATAFNATSAHTIASGATLGLNGFNNTIGSLAGAGTVHNNTATNATLTVGDNTSTTFSGTLANGSTGTLGLTKVGTGTLSLSGTSNALTGNVAVNGGFLATTGTFNNGAGTTSIGSAASTKGLLYVPTGGSYSTSTMAIGNNATGLGSVVIRGGAVAATSVAANTGTVIANGGYGGFFMSGGSFATRRLDFGTSVAATAIGVTQISGGTFNWTEYILTRSGRWEFTVTGGTVARTGTFNVISLGGESGISSGSMTVAGGSLDNSGQNITFGRTGASAATSSLNLNAGTLTTNAFTITPANFTAAYINFNGGTLKASSTSATFMGNGLTAAYVNGAFGTFAGGAVVDTNGFNITFSEELRAPTGNGVTSLSVGAAGSGYIGAPYVEITGGGGTGATGYATVDLDPASVTFGQVTGVVLTNPGVGYTSTPTVTLLGGGGTGASVSAAGTAANTSGGLTKTGTGTLTLGGTVANTYTGTTVINAGQLDLAKTAGVNAIAGNITIGDASGSDVLKLQASNQIADTSVVTLKGTLANERGVFRLNGYSETIGGLSGDGVVEHNDTDTGVGSSSSSITLDFASGTQTYAGVIRNTGSTSTGTLALTKAGTGTQVLTGTNAYTGKTTITGGKLSISDESNLGTNPGVATADQLTLNGGTLLTTANLTIDDSNRGITVGAGGGTVETAVSTTATISSVITGGGAITKEGAGTLILTKVNTNTGATAVNAGTLQVGVLGIGSTHASSTVSLNGSSAVLAGSGTVNGSVVVTTGQINPGDSAGAAIGTLTIGGDVTLTGGGSPATRLTLQLAATSASTINDAAGIRAAQAGGTLATYLTGKAADYDLESGSHDKLVITGALNLNTGGRIALDNTLGYSFAFGDVFDLLDWGSVNLDFDGAGLLGSFDSGSDLLLPSGVSFDTSLFSTNGIIVVVPEPSRTLFLMLGLLGLMLRRRRRSGI